jgi:hypothetical protein
VEALLAGQDVATTPPYKPNCYRRKRVNRRSKSDNPCWFVPHTRRKNDCEQQPKPAADVATPIENIAKSRYHLAIIIKSDYVVKVMGGAGTPPPSRRFERLRTELEQSSTDGFAMSANLIFLPTRFTSKFVLQKRRKRRPLFIENPTTGALEVAPEHRDEVCRALNRTARSISRRIIFQARVRKFFLSFRIARLRITLAAMRVFNKPIRVSFQGIPDRHVKPPKKRGIIVGERDAANSR